MLCESKVLSKVCFPSLIVNINLLLTNTLFGVAEYAGLNFIALIRSNWISIAQEAYLYLRIMYYVNDDSLLEDEMTRYFNTTQYILKMNKYLYS